MFDPRNYRLDSSKLLKIGFKRKYSIKNAIEELKIKFNERKVYDNINFYSIKKLKKIKAE